MHFRKGAYTDTTVMQVWFSYTTAQYCKYMYSESVLDFGQDAPLDYQGWLFQFSIGKLFWKVKKGSHNFRIYRQTLWLIQWPEIPKLSKKS